MTKARLVDKTNPTLNNPCKMNKKRISKALENVPANKNFKKDLR